MKKKVLIFYSKTGSGHLKAAEAIKEEIEAQMKDVEVILHEGLEDTHFGLKINTSFAYTLFSSHLQGFYNFIYILTNNKLGVKFLRLFIRSLWGKNLRSVLEKIEPDLIITTHHHISPSTISKYDPKVPFLTIVTDLGYPHFIWYDKNLTKIITPTEVIADFAKKITGNKNGQVIHIDYPLKNHFLTKTGQGLTNSILVLGGGLGAGNILGQVKILLKHFPEKMIIAVCGNNRKLFERLSRIKNSNLEVHAFVDHLVELYVNSDIIVTKAGPGTIVEAATLKKPLVVTSWVGMQEKDNVDFVTENNLGVFEPDIKKLPDAIKNVYSDYEKYTVGKRLFEQGTKKIVDYIFREFS